MEKRLLSGLQLLNEPEETSLYKQNSLNKCAYRLMLEIQHLAPHFSYIYNINANRFEWFSDTVSRVTGYEVEELNSSLIQESIHPHDLPTLLEINEKINHITDFIPAESITNFKIIYDYRFKKKNCTYVRLLHQVIHIWDEVDNSYKKTGLVTDISFLNKVGQPSLSVMDINTTEIMEINLNDQQNILPQNPLTCREKEIASLIIQGYCNKDIASKLFISLDTVKNHRKHIFSKTACNTSVQLFKKCIAMGWVDLLSHRIH